jgi:hypothetical protein
MTHILVERVKSDDDATLSIVSVDGRFICFGLEDEYREEKVAGDTRIPAGFYHVGLRTVGGFHGRYSRKFPDFHQGMLQVLDVPGFEYILIHIGNTDEDTAGCLLVGKGANVGSEITISNSTGAYKELYKAVIDSAKGGHLTIEYQDNDLRG